MDSEEFLSLKKERTQLRRVFTIQANALEGAVKEGNKVSEEFTKLADKAERLFKIDKQVSELLYSLDVTEEILEEEFDSAESYRDKWTTLCLRNDSLVKREEASTKGSINTSSDPAPQTNYKLPKLKFKTFDGQIKNWICFWSQFKRIHEDPKMDLDTKFHYLYQSTEEGSPARELIDSFPPLGGNYQKAVDLMKARFGRDDLLINLYVRELLGLGLHNVSGKTPLSLRSLYDRLETQLRALETLGVASDKYACMLQPLVESSLPESILREWERKRVESDPNKHLSELLDFVRREVESEERISLAKSGITSLTGKGCSQSTPKRNIDKSHKQKIATASDLVNVKAKSRKLCIFCEGQHANEDCYKARDFDLAHIQKLLMEGRCCLICLKRGHLKRDCRTLLKCIICKKKHAPLVCPERKGGQETPPEPAKSLSVDLSDAHNNRVYLKTLKVLLQNKGKAYPCRLFFDDGSQRSYVTKRMVNLLQYEPFGEEKIVHSLFGGKRTSPESHVVYTIQVASVVNDYVCNFKALNKEIICEPLPAIENSGPLASELKRKDIVLSGEEWGPIDILVGADIAGKLFTGRKLNLSNGLVALETSLGWTLMGKPDEGNTFMTNVCCTNVDISPTDLWRLDLIGIEDGAQIESKNERQLVAKQHFEKTVKIEEDGRYEVRLPWLDYHPPLPSNYDMALKRLDSVMRKMTPEVIGKYNGVLHEWISENIIEEVPSGDPSQGHYLPHRAVIKERGTTKIRPVFDASAKSKGAPSLNQCLHTGPNLIELIPSLLIRFRLEQFGVVSDVKKAFLQISVNVDDRDYLRFLWRDHQGNLITFRHRRVVFGVSSSPFLLGAAFGHLLDTFNERRCREEAICSKTVMKLKKALYVDNCVTSVSGEDELQQFIKEATYIFSTAKFELRGWEHTDPDLPTSTVTPVLGIQWDRKNDVIKINVPKFEETEFKEVTRRSLLATVQKIFDPIGVTAPTTLIPKLLIQQTWVSGGDWDSKLNGKLRRRFEGWLSEAPRLKEIEIPRWIMGVPRARAEVSLHTFCDASQSAYAAVCFVRVTSNETTEVYLVGAKSRVAPIKKCTIPRLELLAAVIGSRLAHTIQAEVGIEESFYWSDSSTTLAWIKRDEPWGVFVFNRVLEIRKLTAISSWRHISGTENPADLLSRGCSPRKLLLSKWWEGPDWLKYPEGEWPVSNIVTKEEEILAERKKKVIISMDFKNDVDSGTSVYTRYFSTYSKIVREVGWIYRYINNLRERIRTNPGNELFARGELSVEEYRFAETRLLRMVQAESFDGIEDKAIKRLKPQLDSEGLIRIRTKIWARKDAIDFRAPIILSPTHTIVKRLVFEVHLRNSHVIGQTLLNILREKYWIIRGRQAVRRIVKECKRCLRYSSKKMECESPPLPEDRVRDARIFEVIGIDLAGPLYLRDGQKVWVTLFTCAIYRAVHLDVVPSLSTEDFLLTLRRFIARRGRPTLIITDNGTNFKGSSHLLSCIDWKRIVTCGSTAPIEWRFNPPAAPWWGGFFERLIGTMKKLLRRNLGRASLNRDELYTIICECEAMINARPITYVSDQGEDLIPITPQMFIGDIGEAGIPDLEEVDAAALNRRLRYRFKLKEELKRRFRAEYLGQLAGNAHNPRNTREPVVGEIVLIGSDNNNRLDWPLAIIEGLVPGKDGRCRLVQLRTANGRLSRPIQRIYPLEVFSESGGNGKMIDQKKNYQPAAANEGNGMSQGKGDQLSYCEAKTRCGRKVRLPVRYQC